MALDPDCKAALDGIIENTKYEDVVKFLEDYGKFPSVSGHICRTIPLTTRVQERYSPKR